LERRASRLGTEADDFSILFFLCFFQKFHSAIPGLLVALDMVEMYVMYSTEYTPCFWYFAQGVKQALRLPQAWMQLKHITEGSVCKELV